MARVTLEGVRKVYDNGFVAVHGVDLVVEDGEFVVLVGPSGSGKSTTLRIIAGLESLSDGQLSIGGRVVNDVPPNERDVAMVFQSYALYPHMSVYENMAFALHLRKLPGKEIEAALQGAVQANQFAAIPSTTAGTYYLLVRGQSEPAANTPITLLARVLPFGITDVVPDKGGDSRYVTTTILGAQFDPQAIVKL